MIFHWVGKLDTDFEIGRQFAHDIKIGNQYAHTKNWRRKIVEWFFTEWANWLPILKWVYNLPTWWANWIPTSKSVTNLPTNVKKWANCIPTSESVTNLPTNVKKLTIWIPLWKLPTLVGNLVDSLRGVVQFSQRKCIHSIMLHTNERSLT